jgi:NADP-dependent alcohol dehydrogenase
LAYGGGSIFKNGIHEQVINNLKGFEIVEFAGIEPIRILNIDESVAVIKEQNIDFILAVGGGSVIDGVKIHFSSRI